MSDQPRPTVPPWLYKLFTGHQYPYVRRQAKFANRNRGAGTEGEPTREQIDAHFWQIFPRCTVKVLQEVKAGMIVSFKELGTFQPGEYQGLLDAPEAFLSERYGKKKIKVNFYDGDNFVCTTNFKVGGWTEHADDEET